MSAVRKGQEIPYVAGGTLYTTLCNNAQHYNGVDVREPRPPGFTVTNALNSTFSTLSFLFFHDPELYRRSIDPALTREDAKHLSLFLQTKLSARSQCRMAVYEKALALPESADPMVAYWLHLFALQHLPELLPGQSPFPGEHCTIHAGCMPALPIVEHTKFIIRGKEPLCTLGNNSVHLLLTKIFNKALPHVCMFRSLNLTMLPILDNHQVYEYMNDLLFVFLTGGYPTATVRPSLTLSAAILSILRAFDPRKSLVEQHMGVYLTNFSDELLTICKRKFKKDENGNDIPRERQLVLAREMALTIHNTWVYQFVLLYHIALYECIHVGGSLWMLGSDSVHNIDKRHRAYLDLIKRFADRIRATFIQIFEPFAERMVSKPLDPQYLTAWSTFLAQCGEMNIALKVQLPKYIVRTRTSVEKRLDKSISSYIKNIKQSSLTWREKELLGRLAAVTVCDPRYCGPKFRVLQSMGVSKETCAAIEDITFGFMGGVSSKHMTDKRCDEFVRSTSSHEVFLISHYLMLCRHFSCISSSPLERSIVERQRAALLGKFGRIDRLDPIQHSIFYCLAHQECLLSVIGLEGRHTHISALQLTPVPPTLSPLTPWKDEALADLDGPRRTGPWLCISQFTGKPVCSYSVGSKKANETLLLDNRTASRTSLLGLLIAFARYKPDTYCVDCGSRCGMLRGLWTERGPTCGIHHSASKTGAGYDFVTGDPAVDNAYSYRRTVPVYRCLSPDCEATEQLTRLQVWDENSCRYRAVSLCGAHFDDALTYNSRINANVTGFNELTRILHNAYRSRSAKKTGANERG